MEVSRGPGRELGWGASRMGLPRSRGRAAESRPELTLSAFKRLTGGRRKLRSWTARRWDRPGL